MTAHVGRVYHYANELRDLAKKAGVCAHCPFGLLCETLGPVKAKITVADIYEEKHDANAPQCLDYVERKMHCHPKSATKRTYHD